MKFAACLHAMQLSTGLAQAPDDAAGAEVAAFGQLFATEDALEGCTAFVEKRDATWKGK
jgi:enoyl-CoA hydratase/carnithine racemase